MTGNPAADFFLAIAIALGAARAFGAAARRIGQPAVVGEICAGILASPMVLSASVSEALLPSSVKPLLSALANVGLATFMFIIGYELDGSFLRRGQSAALKLAAGSVLIPLAGGVAVAVPLAATYAPGSRTAFCLFVGVAMSVTAFPVLARILADRGLNRQPIGGLALAAAAIGDLVAWVCLAGVIAFAGVSGQWRVALLPLYLLVMVTAVRPLLARALRAADRRGTPSTTLLPALVVVLMLSCAATEWLGIHFIFGAFTFGAMMPKSALEQMRIRVIEQMEHAGLILLPLYFIVAGTKVNLDGFDAAMLGTLLAVIVVAIGTKGVGAYAGARLSGLPHSDALPLSVLMNTRGLTEVVIVAVALDLGLIDGNFYSMMVVMAVLTTAMTGPLLTLVGTGGADSRAAAPSGAVETAVTRRPVDEIAQKAPARTE